MSISTFIKNMLAASKIELGEVETKMIEDFQKAETEAHQEIVSLYANLSQRVSNVEDTIKHITN